MGDALITRRGGSGSSSSHTVILYSLIPGGNETINYVGTESGAISIAGGVGSVILPTGTYSFTSSSTIWASGTISISSDMSINCWYGTALYWYGYVNTNITQWSTRNGTATYKSTYIDFHATANNAQFYTSSPIDITSFSTLSMYGRHDGQMQTTGPNAFGIAESGTNTNFVASVTVDTTLKQYDIDISAQSGSYYIKHSLYSYNVYSYAIWFE